MKPIDRPHRYGALSDCVVYLCVRVNYRGLYNLKLLSMMTPIDKPHRLGTQDRGERAKRGCVVYTCVRVIDRVTV